MLKGCFAEQFEALQDELERRREECIQLRTVLANRAHDLRSLTQTSYGKDVDIVNEDGELALAYQTQKQVNRLVMQTGMYEWMVNIVHWLLHILELSK